MPTVRTKNRMPVTDIIASLSDDEFDFGKAVVRELRAADCQKLDDPEFVAAYAIMRTAQSFREQN